MQDSTITTPFEASSKGKRQMTTEEKEGLLGMTAATLMYIVWLFTYSAVSGEKPMESGSSMIVFVIVLARFFMDYVPDLRKDKLSWKVVTFGWLLLPMAWSAVTATMMGLLVRYVMPLIRGLFGG